MMQGVLDLFGSILPLPPAAPDATRRIRLGDEVVAYRLTRAKRRTIGMLIGADGLTVRAPRWVSLHEIETALHERSAWIVRKLQEAQAHQQQQAQARIAWGDGCALPYLGHTLRVHLQPEPGCRRPRVHCDPHADSRTHLHLVVPMSLAQAGPFETARLMRETVQAWMKDQAHTHFHARLTHFAPLLAVQWHQLALSNARTRWGSAGRTSDGRAVIRLHWRLMHHAPEVIDYVVVHELSHLRVMDHSPRFWQTVASVLPDYARHRRTLRDQPLPPWA